MNFTELREELFARGTDYLNEDAAGVARADRWLNQAIREICSLQMWPFLQETATGSAGTGLVSIPDLRRVRSVVTSEGHPLQRTTRENLLADGLLTTETGEPERYWIEDGNTVRAYPVGGTITVHYIKRVAPISGTEEPPFDEEYHDLVVDRAMIKAYKDSDNFEAAAALKAEFDAGVSAMAEDYMVDSRDAEYIDPYGTDM